MNDAVDKKISIFISHKIEDEAVAKKIEEIFNRAGRDWFIIHTCENIPVGENWRRWIEHHLGESNFLFFLCTRPGAQWDWSLYETGLFEGLVDEGRIVVFYGQHSQIPDPISHLQAIEATKPGIATFLKDFFGDSIYTKLPGPINPGYASDESGVLRQDAETIAEFFSGEINKRHFTNRMLITVPSSEDLSSNVFPRNSTVVAEKNILEMFNVTERDQTKPWSWGEILEHIDSNQPWVSILEECMCKAHRSELFDPVQETFQPTRSADLFKPLLHSLETYHDGSQEFCVLFVKQFSTGAVDNAPEDHASLLSSLALGSRLQWEVYDKYVNSLKRVSSESELQQVCVNLSKAKDNIEKEARFRKQVEYHGNDTRDRLVWAFESKEDQDNVENNLLKQKEVKTDLDRAIRSKNVLEITNNLERLQILNLQLMQKISARYNQILTNKLGVSSPAPVLT
jgi:hypothetical protein